MAYSFVPLYIIAASILGSLLIEIINYVFVYHTSMYKRLVDDIERSAKKMDQLKTSGSKSKQAKKTQKRFDGTLKMNMRDFVVIRTKSATVMFVFLIVLYTLVSRIYDGKAVGKLPFEPLSFMTRLTHRGVLGEDMTEYGAVFVYMLCSLGVRQNMQKLIGLGPTRSMQKHLAMDDFAAKFFKTS